VLNRDSEEYKEIALAMNAELQHVFNHNIQFFKRINHPFFSKFIDYQPKRLRLRLSEEGYINLYNVNSGLDVYPEEPGLYAEKQAKVFLKNRPHYFVTQAIVDEGYKNVPFTEYLTKTNTKYQQMYPKKIQADQHLAEQLFMYGAGLCLQLQYVLNALDVKNLIIFEPDADAIYNSLFVVDWEAILGYFNRDGYQFHIFNVHDSDENLASVNSILRKKGFHRCSKIDYYYHYDNNELRSLAANLKYYIMTALGVTGYYEDERVGLAQSVVNFQQSIPFSRKNLSAEREYCNTPVLIVGNGPSLDQLEDFLQEVNE